MEHKMDQRRGCHQRTAVANEHSQTSSAPDSTLSWIRWVHESFRTLLTLTRSATSIIHSLTQPCCCHRRGVHLADIHLQHASIRLIVDIHLLDSCFPSFPPDSHRLRFFFPLRAVTRKESWMDTLHRVCPRSLYLSSVHWEMTYTLCFLWRRDAWYYQSTVLGTVFFENRCTRIDHQFVRKLRVMFHEVNIQIRCAEENQMNLCLIQRWWIMSFLSKEHWEKWKLYFWRCANLFLGTPASPIQDEHWRRFALGRFISLTFKILFTSSSTSPRQSFAIQNLSRGSSSRPAKRIQRTPELYWDFDVELLWISFKNFTKWICFSTCDAHYFVFSAHDSTRNQACDQ